MPSIKSPQPRESIHQRPKLEYAVSTRFSYFIASRIVPHDTEPPIGTCGTQLAPPGTCCVAFVITPLNAGRPPFATRVRSILAAAAAKFPARMYASAARRSFSAFMNSG